MTDIRQIDWTILDREADFIDSRRTFDDEVIRKATGRPDFEGERTQLEMIRATGEAIHARDIATLRKLTADGAMVFTYTNIIRDFLEGIETD